MRAAAAWGVLIGLCGLFALPASAAPPPEQTQPEPVLTSEPTPEPVTPEPVTPEPVLTPEPAPEPTPEPQLPAYDQPLPSYDELPIAPEVSFDGVPLEVENPPTGRGRLALGSILLGGGLALTGMSTTLIILDTDLAAWIPGAMIGASAAVIGAVFVATGDLRRRTHRDWAAAHAHAPVPPRGDGLVASGLTCIIAGTMGTMIGGVSLVAFQDVDDPPYGQVLVPLGLVSVVTGVGLLAAGSVRRKQYDRWPGVVPSLSLLLPGNRQTFGGLSLGFAGRF